MPITIADVLQHIEDSRKSGELAALVSSKDQDYSDAAGREEIEKLKNALGHSEKSIGEFLEYYITKIEDEK